MKRLNWLLLSFLLLSVCGCVNNQYSDEGVAIRAQKIVQKLNKDSLSIFKKWNYFSRGNALKCTRVSKDTMLYMCVYIVQDDSVTISIESSLLPLFKKDFPLNIVIDTGKYSNFTLSKHDKTVSIECMDKNGEDHILAKAIRLDTLFKVNDPFKKLGEFFKLKENLGITGIFYRSWIGNFVEFNLSPVHILTYLPDSLDLNPEVKNIWSQDFKKGKMLNQNWNLRKRSRSIDTD